MALVLQSGDHRGDTGLVQDGRVKRRGQTPHDERVQLSEPAMRRAETS